MKVGVPKEIKIHEYRVGLIPAGVRELVDSGHHVLVQSGAGAGIGFEDSHYQYAGATIAQRAQEVFASADLVVKVKEPQIAECQQLRSGQTLFTYLHLAADREQAQALMASGATAIAYETVTAPDGSLPLLTPMSEVAGRMSVQVGANSLQKANGGFGVLLGGVPGVAPAKVVILGGGVSGTHAAEMAVGLKEDGDLAVLPAPAFPECTTWAVLPRERVLRDYALEMLKSLAPQLDRRDLRRVLEGNAEAAWPTPPTWVELSQTITM